MINPWDNRYNGVEYYYGKEPNKYFANFLTSFNTKGKLLLPAEGEGRNAVFAAKQGWDVHAFDSSESAQRKALQLAAENDVKIQFLLLDIKDFIIETPIFDLAALIFVHQPEWLRRSFHNQIIKALKPGGQIFMIAFSKEQIAFKSGGPSNIEMLYSIEMLNQDFMEMNTQKLVQQRVILQEGRHYGEADVLIYSGTKPL